MKIINIIYGESAAACLKNFYKTSGLNDEIYVVSDDLSIGPLDDLVERKDYITSILAHTAPKEFSSIELEKVVERAVRTWPQRKDFTNKKIIVWHSLNVVEQLMLRLVVSSLPYLKLHEIALTEQRATGEYTSKRLGAFLGIESLITDERKHKLTTEWESYVTSNAAVRIWRDHSIQNVAADYYDRLIMDHCTTDFLPATRVVGMALGLSDQVVSDMFLLYRVHQLITQQRIEYQGTLDSMRTFEVRLATV